MYAEDTFFQLDTTGQLGLVLIAGALAVAAVAGTWLLARRAHWPTRLLAALGVFLVHDWLSPQVFYLFYLAIIEGLPLQWAIGWYPDPVSAAETLLLQGKATLANHGRALLGWVLIVVSVGFGRFRPPIRHH